MHGFFCRLLECIAELRQGCESKNIAIVQREELWLRDLIQFARAIDLANVPVDAVFAFLDLRSIATDGVAAADHAIRDGWLGLSDPGGIAARFEKLREKAHKKNLELSAAFGDQVAIAELQEEKSRPVSPTSS